jgi:Flp pilus assembly protein TadB
MGLQFVARMPVAWLLLACVGMITVAAIVQQVGYPETGAWIVAFIGAFYLLLFFVVKRLADRNHKQ